MKKPLLLLVDDDPAVLSALEVELDAAFGEIVRIEAFEDPRAVLEMLPRWSADRRAIAVAVVDQRMPRMTGVELLAALRSSAGATAAADGSEGEAFHPARHLRAVLLTGYAGLESALAARNEAGVERYLEKPWQPGMLQAQLRRLLLRHLADARAGSYLEFREITQVDEIRQLLALRYEIYSASPSLRHLLPEYSRKRLDMDAYDPGSRFLALFNVDDGGEQLIGGLRLIGLTHPDAERAIVQLANLEDSLRLRAARATPHAIELPEKWPDGPAVEEMLSLIKQRGERVVEASRMVLVSEHRGRSVGFGHAALAMYEGAAAYVCELFGVENTFQCCTASYQAAASRVGFRLAESTVPMWSRRLQDTVVWLHGRREFMPTEVQARVRSIGAGLRVLGGACRCAAYPACLGRPYETREFRSVDLFCPQRAESLLGAAASGTGVTSSRDHLR